MFEVIDTESLKVTKDGTSLILTIKELSAAMESIRNQKVVKKSDFITLYTDASYYHQTKRATLGYSGKCAFGQIQNTIHLEDIKDNNVAEILAIEAAINESLEAYPELEGFFVNTDSKTSQSVLMQINNIKSEEMHVIRERIMHKIGTRWIRTKWVKAHTNKNDIRSYMNNKVDSLTRIRVKS